MTTKPHTIARVFITVHHSRNPFDYTATNYTIEPAEELTDDDIEAITHDRVVAIWHTFDRFTVDSIDRLVPWHAAAVEGKAVEWPDLADRSSAAAVSV